MSVNKVILVGNLGKDPEVTSLESGVKVASFSIATSESYKDKNSGEKITKTEWHNITLWRGLAEVAEKYLNKGSQVYIEGKLQTRSYEDKEGVTRYRTDIVGSNMTMLGSNKGSGSDGSAPADSAESKVEDYAKKESAPNTSSAPVLNADEDDDLPF